MTGRFVGTVPVYDQHTAVPRRCADDQRPSFVIVVGEHRARQAAAAQSQELDRFVGVAVGQYGGDRAERLHGVHG